MKISRPSRPLRTDLFATRERETTTGIMVMYTDQCPDHRIDAAYLDMLEAHKGFFGCPYHYVVRTTGEIEIGRNPRTRTSKGTRSRHKTQILIGIVGGRDQQGNRTDNQTDAQREAIDELMQALADALQVPLEVEDFTERYAQTAEARGNAHAQELILEAIYSGMTEEELAKAPLIKV